MPQLPEAPAPVNLQSGPAIVEANIASEVAQVEQATFVPHESIVTGFEQSELAFQTQLDRIGRHVPEASDKSEQITRGASQLIEAFGVKPEFFDDDNRSAVFTSLALSAANIEDTIRSSQGITDKAEIEKKQAFVASATFLLTRNYSKAYPDLVASHEQQASSGHGEIKRSAVSRFEQPEVTVELREFIEREGILDELKSKFAGIGGEEPEYHVLSIGRDNAWSFYDVDANGITKEEAKTWAEGLKENAEKFSQLIPRGELAASASGFAVEFEDAEGGHHVFIPILSAELLMAEKNGIVRSESMKQFQSPQRTKGTIRHEFVHTRGGLVVEDELGISVEERRAEYFSGDTGEYYEVKEFFAQLRALHNHAIGDIFEESLQSTHTEDPVTVYELMGKYYGLETVAEIAAAQPRAYVKHAKSEFTKEMVASVGGFDSIIERDAMSEYVDLNVVRNRLKNTVNMLRGAKAVNGIPDAETDAYLESQFFGPVFKVLKMRISDIPYSPAELN